MEEFRWKSGHVLLWGLRALDSTYATECFISTCICDGAAFGLGFELWAVGLGAFGMMWC